MARALDDKADAMIFSLMDDLMALSLQSKDLAKITHSRHLRTSKRGKSFAIL